MSYQSLYTGKQMDSLKNHGLLSLQAEFDTPMALADTAYPILGTFADSGTNNFYTTASNGQVTYNGNDGDAIIVGTSDVEIDGVTTTEIEYMMYKNGVLVPNASTPHTFSTNATTETIAITSDVVVENGDVFQVYVKCIDSGRTLTVKTLNVTFKNN